MDKTAIMLLAAGGSSRLGQPKQLLEYKGKTLLQHIVDEALSAKAAYVVVVLGANHELIAERTKLDGTVVIINEQWQSGMASSIRAGVEALADDRRFDSVLITLCDQPHVDHFLMKELVKKQQDSGSTIVSCSYGDTVGVPAVFSREMFPSLLSLQGHEGARKLIAANPHVVEKLDFPKGIIDIDTLADYQGLQNKKKNKPGEV